MEEKTLLAQEFIRTLAQLKKLGFPKIEGIPLRQSEHMLLFTLSNCMEPEAGGMKVSDLSDRLNITPAAVTHMINSLESDGILERVNDKRDRRIVLIRPTDKGNEIMRQMNTLFFERMKELIGVIGENDTREFIRILNRIFGFMKDKRNIKDED